MLHTRPPPPKKKKKKTGIRPSYIEFEDHDFLWKKYYWWCWQTSDGTDTGCVLTDEGLGNTIESGMTQLYKQYLQSSKERLLDWKNGKVSAGEKRILMTNWLGEPWGKYAKNNQATITNVFTEQCGMYNALDGSKRYLIKIIQIFWICCSS